MNPRRARLIVFLVALALALLALDWLLVVPHWLAAGIWLGNLAVIGLIGWLRAVHSRRRE
jgi:hypothetical protein